VLAAGAPVTDVVPLGADLTRFRPAPVEQPPRLVHIAGLNRVKDQDLLLAAFALVAAHQPDVRLTLAGGDTLDGHHLRLADRLGLASRVDFLGHVPHEQLAAVVGGATFHVLASHHDAGPVAVLEAAACGVPTVGTDVGHVHDFASLTPAAAVAVADRSPATLAAAMTDLLADEPRRAALAAAALRWSGAHDAQHTASAFEMLYRRLSASSARA